MDDDFIRYLKGHKQCSIRSSKEGDPKTLSALKTSYAPQSREKHICEYGGTVFISDYELDTVIWGSNFITLQTIGTGRDAISFDFCGCVMAAYLIDGIWTAAHIHCGPTFDYDRKRTWIRYYLSRQKAISQLKMFQPDYRFYRGKGILTWGVITKEGRCYSVYVEPKDGGKRFKVRQIREHPVPSTSRSYHTILHPALIEGEDNERNFIPLKKAWDDFWSEQEGENLIGDGGCCCCCVL